MNGVNFVAIDFETATSCRASACEVGLVYVENGQVVSSSSWFIRPEGNVYDPFNISIHGITPRMTAKAQSFDEIWPMLSERINGRTLVAHYAPFDMGVIRDECSRCGLPLPEFRFVDSCYLARFVVPGLLSYSLEPLCQSFDINVLNHHRAGDDAWYAAQVMLSLFDRTGAESMEELVEKFNYRFGEFSGGNYKPFLRHQVNSGRAGLNDFASGYQADAEGFDEDNPFYGKEVVFTGKMVYERRDLMKMVMDIGGFTKDSVTKTTDYLVVGTLELGVVGPSGLSGKLKKAMQMIEKGHHINVISEADFFEMLGNSAV